MKYNFARIIPGSAFAIIGIVIAAVKPEEVTNDAVFITAMMCVLFGFLIITLGIEDE